MVVIDYLQLLTSRSRVVAVGESEGLCGGARTHGGCGGLVESIVGRDRVIAEKVARPAITSETQASSYA